MRHFEEELEELRKRLLEMSGLVEAAIYRSVHSLLDRDEEQAQLVMQNESRINLLEIEIDERATRLLALDQPVASDLRFIRAASKINSELERMGDLAVNIVGRSMSLIREAGSKPVIDIPHLATLVESMVRKALDAFVHKDAALARSVLLSDDAVDELRSSIYSDLISHMEKDPSTVRPCVDLLFVVRNLERMADHSTNIAEHVLFMVEGVDVRHHAESKSKSVV